MRLRKSVVSMNCYKIQYSGLIDVQKNLTFGGTW